MKTYSITEDKLYQNFIKNRPGLSQASKQNYIFTLTKFCQATKLTLEEIIQNCKSQQNRVIEKVIKTTTNENEEIIEKEITEFDVNNPNSNINKYLENHINYCKQKGNSNKTINNNIDVISVVLDYYNVKLPKINKLPDDSQTWTPLTKEDIKYVMADSTLTHASLISLLKSSGMRIQDAVNLTISDLMEGTKDYHNFNDVESFIDYAPSGMICKFEFNPHKTKRFGLKCITFTDPESTDLILQNLRRIKNEYLPRINRDHGLNLKMSKSDALFGNKRKHFKGHMTPHNISDIFNKKNKKLKDHRIQLIKEAIQKGELPEEDYEEEINKIPKFHAHGLRKFFSSVIATNCGNLRICAIMEGHSSPLRTDNSYVQIDSSEIKEAYLAAIPDLSLENVEAKVYTSEIRKEMEDKINRLENELQEKESKSNNLEDRLSKIEKLFSDVDEMTDEELLNIFSKRKKI